MSLCERNVRILQNKTYRINWVCCSINIYNSKVSVYFSKLRYFNSFTSQNIHVLINNTNEKVLGDTQTLCSGSKLEPKIFAPPQTLFPGAQDGQNLVSWRWSLPSPTNPVWWRLMHAISSYRGNGPTHKQTHRQDRLQYNAPQLASMQCNQQLSLTDNSLHSGGKHFNSFQCRLSTDTNNEQ